MSTSGSYLLERCGPDILQSAAPSLHSGQALTGCGKTPQHCHSEKPASGGAGSRCAAQVCAPACDWVWGEAQGAKPLRRGPFHGDDFLGAGILEHERRIVRREAEPGVPEARHLETLQAYDLLDFSARDRNAVHPTGPDLT